MALALGLGLACDGGPQPSASEGLVFVRRHGPEKVSPRDLAWARLSDGHVEVLTTPQTEEMWPYYSSVTKRVVFVRGSPGRRRGRLWLWDPATGEQRPATGVNERWESWPDWSAREPLLAYVAQKRGRGGVEILDFASGSRTLVAPSASLQDSYLRPSFGPDPGVLVAQHLLHGNSDVSLLRADRPPEPLVVDPSSDEEKPVFRGDGKAVLYARSPLGGGRSEIREIEIATRAIRVLAPDPTADHHTIAVSPTRNEIAFVKERGDGESDIWLLSLPDGPARRLTETPDWAEYAPQWSPDGERIAVTGGRLGQPGDSVRVVDRTGAVLFETPGFSPDWMPPPAAGAPR